MPGDARCDWHPETVADRDSDEDISRNMFPNDDLDDFDISDI